MTDDAVERVWRELTATRPFPPAPGDDRPSLALNMVVSVDGRTAIAGRVGALTGPVDQGILRRLRASADAVLVGASTVRAEGYSSLLRPEVREQRRARGEPEQPLLAVVTGSLELAPDARVLQDTASPLVIVTAAERPLPEARRAVHRLEPGAPAGQRAFALRPALEALRAEHGVRTIVCEGGPALASSLLEEDLVDELFVTVSPMLVRDDTEPTIARGAGEPRSLSLLASTAQAGFVFARYAVGP